ncbi:MAG: peptidylprolyl isomerase, partial [Vicinamibacteria bacterium]
MILVKRAHLARTIPAGLIALAAAGTLALWTGLVQAEVIEEIVSWVNDDIITRSSLDEREQATAQDLFGKFSGDDLDRKLADSRGALLRDMISEKLLIQQAERLYDLKKMRESLIKNFKEQEKITNDQDLVNLLKGEGMTLDDLKRRLLEYNAPQSVIQYEVRDKVSVSDAEVEAYYRDHQKEFASAEQVTFREIVFLSEGRGMEEAMNLARQASEKLREGGDFEALAREKSEAASRERGGLL